MTVDPSEQDTQAENETQQENANARRELSLNLSVPLMPIPKRSRIGDTVQTILSPRHEGSAVSPEGLDYNSESSDTSQPPVPPLPPAETKPDPGRLKQVILTAMFGQYSQRNPQLAPVQSTAEQSAPLNPTTAQPAPPSPATAQPAPPSPSTAQHPRQVPQRRGRKTSANVEWNDELCDLLVMGVAELDGRGFISWETIRRRYPKLSVFSGRQLKEKYDNLTSIVPNRRGPIGTLLPR